MSSPNSVRRVRTDLRTSANVFLSNSPRTTSPISIPHHENNSPQQQRSSRRYAAAVGRNFSSSAPHTSHISAHLPARATRLLNRSRLQQCQLSNNGSDSPKSTDSFRRTPSRASSLHHSQRDTNSSSDDLLLHDKSFRNAMIQDVLHFKKQLLRLRRILQETDTLNPFDTNNGQLFASCGLDTKFLEDIDVASLTSSTTDDPLQELADLRRQVVYLQGQVEDRDRTIRMQKTLIDKLESDNGKLPQILSEKECVNTATQTDRTRPLSIGPEGLSRVKHLNQLVHQRMRIFTNAFFIVKTTTNTAIHRTAYSLRYVQLSFAQILPTIYNFIQKFITQIISTVGTVRQELSRCSQRFGFLCQRLYPSNHPFNLIYSRVQSRNYWIHIVVPSFVHRFNSASNILRSNVFLAFHYIQRVLFFK